MKRNPSKWQGKRKYCKKCKGYRTYGGIKYILLGFIPIKLTTFKNECRCNRYDSSKPTELDKEKCKEVLNKNKEQNND